jgi:hypothetical protein
MVAAVPDLEVFEKASGLFFFNLHLKEMCGFLDGVGNKIIVSKERKKTNDQDDEYEREGNTIKANPSCFKSSDLTVAGERAEGQQGAQESCIRNCPLKGRFWNLIQEVLEHQVEGSLIFIESIHLLKEQDNDIDQH